MMTSEPATAAQTVFMQLDEEGRAWFLLNGGALTLASLDTALGRPTCVQIAEHVWERLEANCAAVRQIARGPAPAYGINTGFGPLCRKRISPDQVETLQGNLIVSHAVGVGDPAPPEVVRWMLLFKILALSHAVSGASRQTLEALCRLLEADMLPVVPTQGSVGASGDLAPLAHMVLPILGRGTVTLQGQQLPAADALTQFNLNPITLGPKEGLALINGTQFMSAYGAVLVICARRLLKHADLIATMSLEAMRGSLRPFDARLQELRPHRGARESAANVRKLMTDSQILPSHAQCERVQDPYSLRCVPQVHGASREAVHHAAEVMETEINSVTDNPVILGPEEVISGGLFHGQPLALVLDYLAMALAELASISERRIYLLLAGAEELPPLLMQNTGLNSGFMLPQYTAAALVSENKGLCMPACVDSIPTSLGQEDHVSMGARSAVKCMRVLENAETVLAIELMCAAQALDYRVPLQPGIGPRLAHGEVRRCIAHAEQDRLFGDDIQTSLALIRSQRLLYVVEKELGKMC
ncbi:MAG TPA: histidine ammonia-lyase [Phycisphaerae bacterium]|nr:histidine ammonia-lyase [Phycisphaerae bacterium]HNU45193.1 histidine ammonia-lyase [Phycisphaerae bacterium]